VTIKKRWWLFWGLLFVISFAVIEGVALMQPEGKTLSQTIVDLSYDWPPIIFLFGLGVGVHVTHFWWHWVPTQKKEQCQVCGKTILLPLLALMILTCAAPARADKFVWPDRISLETFCKQRPYFRDCHNLRDLNWNGDRVDQRRLIDSGCWDQATNQLQCMRGGV
jgi:hypothetical protein